MKKLIMCLIILTGCQTTITGSSSSSNNPVPPNPIVDGGSGDVAYCLPAEQHLQALCDQDPVANSYCCKVVAKTKKGKTFSVFCGEKESEGVFLNAKCLSLVKDCSFIDPCTAPTQ